MIEMTSLDIAKFWLKVKVDKSTPIIRSSKKWFGHCWIWQGHLKKGYGHYSLRQQAYRAHRIAYTICYGNITDNMFICHKCDNPSCVNPDHLFIGTAKQNTRDMILKGRLVRSRSKHRDSESRYPGISFRKGLKLKPWRARIMRDYRTIWCQHFSSEDEAHKARTQKIDEINNVL